MEVEQLRKQVEEHSSQLGVLESNRRRLENTNSTAFFNNAHTLASIDKHIEYHKDSIQKKTRLIEEERKKRNEKEKTNFSSIIAASHIDYDSMWSAIKFQ